MASQDLKLKALLLLGVLLLVFEDTTNAASSNSSNPADELARLINTNRTGAGRLSSLVDNPGLACIALQYVHDYQQACDEVGHERPPATLVNSTFANGCGIKPSTVSSLTGVLLYCQDKYVSPSQAFELLMANNKSVSVIDNANHTQFGVAVGSYGGGSPYYWAALFSDASHTSSSFVFSSGHAVDQHDGCFSGTGEQCSASPSLVSGRIWLLLLIAIATSVFFRI